MRAGLSTELRIVKKWLRERQMSITDLALRAGLTRTTVYNLTSGTSKSGKSRQKLTDAIGLSLWPGITPQPPLVLMRNDPSALGLAIEMARRLDAGIQVEIIDTPTPGRRESLVGHLGPDGRSRLLPATSNEIFESVNSDSREDIP